MNGRIQSALALGSLVLAAGLAAAALLRLGSVPWLQVDWCCLSSWVEATPALDAFAALARWSALVTSFWVLGTSLLYLVAAATGSLQAVRAVAWATLPAVRRWAERAITSGALVTHLALPAAALDGHLVDPGYLPIPAGDATSTTTTATTTGPVLAPMPPVPSPVPDSTPPLTADTGPEEKTVLPGDHFWKLAEEKLAEFLARRPSAAEVDGYWRRVVEANRRSIRSGDPDLIYPGEVVILPPVNHQES